MKILHRSLCLASLCFAIIALNLMVGKVSEAHRASTRGSTEASPGQCYFRDFNGSVYRAGPDITRQAGLGWARESFFWSRIEPKPGEWHWNDTDQSVLGAKRDRVVVLADVGYNTPWDLSIPGNGFSPPERVSDWENFVEHLVARYSAPPFDLRYFQIWNEPTKKAGFWTGTDQEFVDNVYIPAAKIIRHHHCFVVFGGWPASNSLQEFDSVLEYHDAWRWTDFLDIHYEGLPDWQYLYNRWVKAGKCKGVWETELGFTSDPDFISETYLPMLYWSLKTGWTRSDQYKLFWYAAWGAGPDGPKCLSQTNAKGQVVLSDQGKRLAVLNELLGDAPLRVFTGYQVAMGSAKGSTMGFTAGRQIVVAVLLDKASLSNAQPVAAYVRIRKNPKELSVITEDGSSLNFSAHFGRNEEMVTFRFPSNVQGIGILSVAYLRIVP